MKILATCLSMKADIRRPASAGFTILELLVVLALMAGLTGLALPQLGKLYEASERRFEKAQVVDSLAALPFEAFAQQEGFTITQWPGQEEPVPLTLPAGWTLKSAGDAGVRYASNGFCSGGILRLDTGAGVEEFVLQAPMCEPRQR